MKSTPTAAMDMLLNLTPLDLLIMAEAMVALHRLQTLKQPAVSDAETGLLSVWKHVSDSNLYMRSDHTILVYPQSRSFQVIAGWNYWRDKYPEHPEDAFMWFTDG
jgi:hypothetical protein